TFRRLSCYIDIMQSENLSPVVPATPLPNELAACQALIVEQARAIAEQSEKIAQQNRTIQEQQLTINELMQRAFRHRSERYLEDPNQLKLDFGNTPEAADAAAGLAEAVEEAQIVIAEHKRRRRARRKPRNEQLPAHLPRYEVEAPVPDDVKHCAEHGERKVIGYDRTETLEFERPKLKVRVTLYPKYICESEPSCGVAQPPREPGLVEGNRYGTSVAAEIVTGKCGYHLPIYREQDYFAGCGWTVDRSTLLNIFRASAELVHPLALYLRGEVLQSGAIGTDETRVTLLLPAEIPEAKEGDPKSRRIHEVFSEARAEGRKSVSGRMWAYRSLTVPVNVFDFTVSRHRDGPDDFLVAGGFVGTLLGDCYSGYQGIPLRSDARIVRAACNAHARRKIFDARESYPLLSSQFLAMYQELYDIEERGKFLSVGERLELRGLEARPVWQRMRELLDGPAASGLLPKEKFAEALGYLRNQWDALQMYLSDGRIPIDNNETEQLMKQVAIGRKNWLFLGSVAAGERMADLLTLVSSALRNDLDVWAYLKDVLDRLLAGSTDYASLRPDHWAALHPEHIRTYRADERRDRAAAQHYRRARRRAAKRTPV
ncbi:MAG TPA: IS66 family transposase, partial [Thermoanaerobaculaceae bacterium]|nr:IS66 family transposase [Thermoanaerobaculaceae bacterium]